jgi:hypothetical protein
MGRRPAHPDMAESDSLYWLVRRWLGLDPCHSPAPSPRRSATSPTASDPRRHDRRKSTRPSAAPTSERRLTRPCLELCALVTGAVDDLGGVAPFLRAAEAVRARLGEPTDDPATARTRAAALVRWVAELQDRGECDLRITRLHDDDADAAAWVSRDPRLTELVRRLGKCADVLAARDVLAAPGRGRGRPPRHARRRHCPRRSVAGPPARPRRPGQPPRRLSSRQELYRRELPPSAPSSTRPRPSPATLHPTTSNSASAPATPRARPSPRAAARRPARPARPALGRRLLPPPQPTTPAARCTPCAAPPRAARPPTRVSAPPEPPRPTPHAPSRPASSMPSAAANPCCWRSNRPTPTEPRSSCRAWSSTRPSCLTV